MALHGEQGNLLNFGFTFTEKVGACPLQSRRVLGLDLDLGGALGIDLDSLASENIARINRQRNRVQ